MVNITERQKRYLLIITQEYIATGRPVGSSHLINKYKLNTSSATIRNEMAALEKSGFLEKAHTSSGRLPSAKGFTLYANEMKDSNVSKNIKEKLNTIFAKRIMDIDQVLEEAAEAVSEIAELTLVTNSNEGRELLKSIQFVPLNDTNATIVLVSSSGRVESKLITTTNKIEMKDIRISIRILKDRLIDTPIHELAIKTEALTSLIASEIKNYEFVIQKMISKVFDFHTKRTSRVYGRTNLMKKDEFSDPKKLIKIIERLEETSIWESIEAQATDEDETLKISISDSQALISKKFVVNDVSKEISIVGSERMDYEKAVPILKYIDELVQGK